MMSPFYPGSLCRMHLTLCLWAQSWATTSSGVKSLVSPSPLIVRPMLPWHWPRTTTIAPVASVETSTLCRLTTTQLKRVRGVIAGNRLESEVWNCVCQLTVSSRKIRKVAPLVEFRKWLMSWLGSNRKKWQLWTGRDQIETKKGKHCWWERWGRPLPISLCIYMGVVSGFLTEHSYDFANSWAVSGPLTVCQRVSKPSKYCNGTKPTTEVRVQETQMLES